MTIQGFTRRLSLGRIAACFFSRSGSAMTFRRTLPWSLLLVALLSACSPVPYQPAIQDSLQNGYRSEEIAPGVFVIEVRQNSRLRLQLNREETLAYPAATLAARQNCANMATGAARKWCYRWMRACAIFSAAYRSASITRWCPALPGVISATSCKRHKLQTRRSKRTLQKAKSENDRERWRKSRTLKYTIMPLISI